jgi:exonuclease III
MKGWKTIFEANGLKKQAGVAILICNKIDFQPKVIKKDKEGHFIRIKIKIFQEELSILNIYAPNTRAATLIKSCMRPTQPARTTLQQDPSAHVYWETLIAEAKRP